jgi:protein TonB
VLVKSLLPPFLKMPPTALPAALIELPALTLSPAIGDIQSEGLSISGVILSIWFLSSLALLIIAILRQLSLRAQLRHAQPVAELVTGQSPVFPWPPIWRADHLPTPLAIGLLRPRIYLTANSGLEDSTTRAVLYHELAHVLRRDGWVVLLQNLAQILHPFNPLVWLMNVRLFRYRERICDDFALQHTGVEPRHYGQILLQHLEAHPIPQLAIQHATCFFETKNGFQQRLTHLLSRKETDMKKFTWKHWTLLAGLVLALIPASWQCRGQLTAPEPPLPSRQQDNLSLVAFDTPPEPIGGFEAIQKNLKYPEIARKAGIEGLVFLEVVITENGEVGEVNVLKAPADHAGLKEAAINAVKSVSWKPALQKGTPVKVRIAMPIKFSLNPDQPSQEPPPPPNEFGVIPRDAIFVAYDKPPEPVGGFAAIQKNLRYPTIARKAGIEGIVIVEAVIDEQGHVIQTNIAKSLGESGCDEAAINAVKSVSWKPASRDGVPVKVMISIPVKFQLNAKRSNESMPPPPPDNI